MRAPNAPGGTEFQSRARVPGRVLGWAAAGVCLAYAALMIPERNFQPPAGAGKRPFVWNQNQFWSELEQEFLRARQADATTLSSQVSTLLAGAGRYLEELKTNVARPGDKSFANLETEMFRLAPLTAASPGRLTEFATLVESARSVTKKQSESWNLNEPKAREQLYRILFGGRMALELVMVQVPDCAPLAAACIEEPSATPAVAVPGVTLRSGDILVSRGSAPTSSLIARGNDYPGSFSHVALLHVDEKTGEATIIESLIERGTGTVPLADFLKEKRLRLVALRLRADLPPLRANPQLPHQAASSALKAARQGHTPYDFAMDFRDPSAKFCSEIASSAYREAGINLWMGMTYISSPTVTAWLGSMGVRHFETQEPSDLEYDPQLRVVAEWRTATNVFQAHLDDTVTDAMLEAAPPGAPLEYSLLKLPLARVAKAYSVVLNALGKVGPVPEGMSATAALRVSKFRQTHHALKERLEKRALDFKSRKGYLPPYWELLRMAKENPPGP